MALKSSSEAGSLCDFMIDVVNLLEIMSPRRGKAAEKVGDDIINLLTGISVDVEVSRVPVTVPRPRIVRVDGVPGGVEMEPNCFEGGVVDGSIIISNLAVREEFQLPNINYSPYSDSVSLATFYPKAAVAVARKSLPLIAGREVRIIVDVEREDYFDRIIVAGNTENPEVVVVTHYDSVLNGAIDNASGVATVLTVMTRWPQVLEEAMVVLTGSEELSYEDPYWGKGYRDALRLYPHAFKRAKLVVVVDSVGFKWAGFAGEEDLIREAFPVGDREVIAKTVLLTSVTGLHDSQYYRVYHSRDDTPDKLRCDYMLDAVKKLAMALGVKGL